MARALLPLLAAGCSLLTEPKDAGETVVRDTAAADTAAPDPRTDTGDTGDTGTPGVDPSCPQPTACISLAEAVDRGFAEIWFESALHVDNVGPYPICMDEWYIYFTEESQDATAGHAQATPESGARFEIPPGEGWAHQYTADTDAAWWCVERTQVTRPTRNFRFNGAVSPDVVQRWIHYPSDTNANGVEDHDDWVDFSTNAPHTQTNIWDTIQEGPVFVVGRTPNYLELSPGESGDLTVEVINLGRGEGRTEVTETIPAGTAAHNWSTDPSWQRENSDGSTTFGWSAKMAGAIDNPDLSLPSTYDTFEISYTIVRTDADCGTRVTSWAPTVDWDDVHGARWQSVGTPLVVACCP